MSKVTLGSMDVKREVLRAAAEVVQVLDMAQYSNCTKIEQLPKGSPEREKLIQHAAESEQKLFQFAMLSQALSAKPDSEVLQNTLASWIASQMTPAEEASSRSVAPERRGPVEATGPSIRERVEDAAQVDPRLRHALANPSPPDVTKALEASGIPKYRPQDAVLGIGGLADVVRPGERLSEATRYAVVSSGVKELQVVVSDLNHSVSGKDLAEGLLLPQNWRQVRQIALDREEAAMLIGVSGEDLEEGTVFVRLRSKRVKNKAVPFQGRTVDLSDEVRRRSLEAKIRP